MNPKPSSAPSSSAAAHVSGRAFSVVASAPVENDTEESGTVPLCSEPEVSSTSETHDLRSTRGVTLDEFLAKNATDFIETEEKYVPFFP